MEMRSIIPQDKPWIRDLLSQHFASPRVVSRGVLHQADELPGFVALRGGSPAGILLYDMRGDQLEVVVVIAIEQGGGVGTALLEEAKRMAVANGCRRAWLITTNDNRRAMRLYERCGWEKVAVHYGAVAESRRLKPEIPEIGYEGEAIKDEIEYEVQVGESDA